MYHREKLLLARPSIPTTETNTDTRQVPTRAYYTLRISYARVNPILLFFKLVLCKWFSRTSRLNNLYTGFLRDNDACISYYYYYCYIMSRSPKCRSQQTILKGLTHSQCPLPLPPATTLHEFFILSRPGE